MGANPWIKMYAHKNSERVQYHEFINIELLQSSFIHIHSNPEFHSGLIKFNHFVVINSFPAAISIRALPLFPCRFRLALFRYRK